MAKLFPHTVKVGTQTVAVSLADVYGTIGSLIGVTKMADDAVIDIDVNASDLIKRGQALRARVGYGPPGVRLKYSSVLVPIDNARNISKLIGKAFKGTVIQTVGIRRSRRLG